MKTLNLLLLFIGTCFVLDAQQIYVNHAASGANDGSSWENAFTTVDAAIAASELSSEIWVAQGIYTPGGESGDVNSSYSFPHDLLVYGGFNGTESSLDQRDAMANVTILTGDHNGDDVDGDLFTNRVDNSLHVFFLEDFITPGTIIDGFTIRNGNTEQADGEGDNRRGAGILTYGGPTITNCIFIDNLGYFGGGIYPRGPEEITISDCMFINNAAGWGGGGVYINAVNGSIKNCIFENNRALTVRGGAVGSFNCVISIDQCEFRNNSATSSSAGALHLSMDEDVAGPTEVFVSNCRFDNNNATWGGGLACYQENLIAVVENCTFNTNSSMNTGGAVTHAFGAASRFTNCGFFDNTTDGSGGAINSQNDENSIEFTSCDFIGNTADFGGAFHATGDDLPLLGNSLTELTINKTRCFGNVAQSQGGAVNISNANLNLISSLIDVNFVVDPNGAGGGVSINIGDSLVGTHQMINSTIVNNTGGLGAGVAHWQDPSEVNPEYSTTLTMQNTLLSNPEGDNYMIEDGTPALSSNGGNLSDDNSAVDFLMEDSDLHNVNPMFINANNFDYVLQLGSPGIDAGIQDGAPETDILNNPRINAPDIGAYENQDVMVGATILNFGSVTAFPNPASDQTVITIQNELNGEFTLSLVALDGKVFREDRLIKADASVVHTMNLKGMAPGYYVLSIQHQEQSYREVVIVR